MGGRGRKGKSCSPNASICVTMCWDLPCYLAFELVLRIHLHTPIEKNFLKKEIDFYTVIFFPPTWIQLLELRSYAWSLKGEIDCFCGLSQFHIYGGISPYYSCWRPTCLHCSELTLRDSAPTVSHQQILPKAGKRHQAKDNIHSQLMNAKI